MIDPICRIPLYQTPQIISHLGWGQWSNGPSSPYAPPLILEATNRHTESKVVAGPVKITVGVAQGPVPRKGSVKRR
jgi:hypothetical protein